MTSLRFDELPAYVKQNDEPSIGIIRIERAVAEGGHPSGEAVRHRILSLPTTMHGKVLLSFDGFADDPRGLQQVPEVVYFCRGLLGFGRQPGAVLRYLLNEQSVVEQLGDGAFDFAGAHFVVQVAFHERCFVKLREGYAKDIGESTRLIAALLKR